MCLPCPSCHPSGPFPVSVHGGPGLPALPAADAFPFPEALERCLLRHQDSAFRILGRLHLGKGSRENKLQIPADMGKGSCSRTQLQGPWQMLRQAWPLLLMDPTWSLPGPTVLHGLQGPFCSQAVLTSLSQEV